MDEHLDECQMSRGCGDFWTANHGHEHEEEQPGDGYCKHCLLDLDSDRPHDLSKTGLYCYTCGHHCICSQLRAYGLRAFYEGIEAGKAEQQRAEYSADIIELRPEQ